MCKKCLRQNMLTSTNLISCNYFNSLAIKTPKPPRTTSLQLQNLNKTNFSLPNATPTSKLPSLLLRPHNHSRRSLLLVQRCHSTLDNNQNLEEEQVLTGKVESGNGVQEGRDWTTSILLFVFWGVLIYYVFNLAPNQTPSRDMYFLKKLLNLKGDDGFRMNEVLVALWYIMGLWPLVYSMILLPTGRSSKSNIPVWPFLVLSCFGGAYALLPYFVLWKPPPPPVDETELSRWPLNVLESKLTAGISLAAGLGLIIYAAIAGGDVWHELYQYFRESKFIHVMSIDFTLLSAFAPFWVYNDMTARKWYDKGSWLLPLSVVPLLGPALYLLLRPSLSEVPALREASLKQE